MIYWHYFRITQFYLLKVICIVLYMFGLVAKHGHAPSVYISSKAMYSYIPNPCGTPSVFYASFFQVVSPSDIISKWLISMWCQQGRED
jgi:hypothetical protein